MPIYEYVCADCKARFETMRSMSKADEPIDCTCCHGSHTKRALSMFAASSKGAGGESVQMGGSGGGCSSCAGHSCTSCGH